MSVPIILNLAIFLALVFFLWVLTRKQSVSLSTHTLIGLVLGVAYGLYLQWIPIGNEASLSTTLEWVNVIGTSYVNLLKMIIMPLVLVMMISAVIKIKELAVLGKIGGSVLFVLISTTMVAALIGSLLVSVFGLNIDGFVEGERELARASVLNARLDSMSGQGLPDMLINFIPQNIFYDLAGSRATSVIAVVIFGVLFGIAALLVAVENPEQGKKIQEAVATLQNIIMKLVRIVLTITPWGILALMTKVVASSSLDDIKKLLMFIVVSYVAILVMFSVHALLLFMNGIKVRNYFSKVWPVLTFAFGSRSSAATIPLNVKTQISELKVASPIANVAATFGATIGQNGCAGIYPAMLATMVAPSVGIDPLSPNFLFTLVLIVAISSFGIAGVGGGATFAALVVLPALGMPIHIVALLISIEPLIDMARTALNVNGSMLAGMITNKYMGSDIAESETMVTDSVT